MLAAFFLIGLLQGAYSACPQGFESHGTSCYSVRGLQSTWVEAKLYCQVLGGDLAKIETNEEEMAVEGMLNIIHGNNTIKEQNYWLDGADILAEGEWRWMNTDGRSVPIVDYVNWAPSQPDDDDGFEDCLEIRYGFGMEWNDNPCNSKESFICEANDDFGGPEVIG